MPLLNNLGNSALDLSGVSSAVSGVDTAASGIASAVGLGGMYSDTIGQVFSDGFSCWGSTFPESKTTDMVNRIFKPFFTALFNQATNQSNINKLIYASYLGKYHYDKLQTVKSWDSCSKKGVKKFKTFFDSNYAQCNSLIAELESKGYQKTIKTSNDGSYTFPAALTSWGKDYVIGTGSDWKNDTFDYPYLTATGSEPSFPSSNGGDAAYDEQADNVQNLVKEPPKNESSLFDYWWLIFLI